MATKKKHTTEYDIAAKQEFKSIAKTKKKKNPRTWVVIYRLVDGPEVNMKRAKAARKGKRKAKKEKTANSE